MSKFSEAIKRAAVALQVTALSHEQPAPAEGTRAACIVPSVPDDASETREARTNAVKIVTQLSRSASIGSEISAEDRAEVMRQLALAGPPMNAFVMNRNTGAMTDLAGKPMERPEGPQNPSIAAIGKRAAEQRPREPERYMRFKKSKPKE